jgi:hypothetical protein
MLVFPLAGDQLLKAAECELDLTFLALKNDARQICSVGQTSRGSVAFTINGVFERLDILIKKLLEFE